MWKLRHVTTPSSPFRQSTPLQGPELCNCCSYQLFRVIIGKSLPNASNYVRSWAVFEAPWMGAATHYRSFLLMPPACLLSFVWTLATVHSSPAVPLKTELLITGPACVCGWSKERRASCQQGIGRDGAADEEGEEVNMALCFLAWSSVVRFETNQR